MNYGIKLTLNNNEIIYIKLYDFNKSLQFTMLGNSFYPNKIDSDDVDFFKISRDQFFDILGNFSFDINYRNFYLFCKKYSLEELLV